MLAMSDRLDIDIQQVSRNIGYSTGCNPPARITSLIGEYVENAHHLIEPSSSYVIRDINLVQGPRVVIDGFITFQSEVIARLLEQCNKVAIFLVTIGNRLEEMVCRLAEDRLIVQAAVLDAIGSDAAEKIADSVQDGISKQAHALL